MIKLYSDHIFERMFFMFSFSDKRRSKDVYYISGAAAILISAFLSFFSFGRIIPGRAAVFLLVLVCSGTGGWQAGALSGAGAAAAFTVINSVASGGIITSGISGAVCSLYSERGRIQQSALFFLLQAVFVLMSGTSDDSVNVCLDMLAAVLVYIFLPVKRKVYGDHSENHIQDDEFTRHITYMIRNVSDALEDAREKVTELSNVPVSADRNIRNRISDITKSTFMDMSAGILAEQLAASSDILRSVSSAVTENCVQDLRTSEKIRKILYENDIGFTSAMAYSNIYGRMFAEIYCHKNSCVNGYSIYKTMSEVFGIAFECGKSYVGDEVRYLISERPPMNVETDIVQKCSEGESRNGDTCDCFRDESGNVYAVISDGMGRGFSASESSGTAVSVFRNLVTGGLDVQESINILNSVMLARTEGDSFVTLDVAKFELDTGKVKMYKCGAAPSVYLRGSSVYRTNADSYPVGIMNGVVPFSAETELADGEIFVMFSDGVPEEMYKHISDAISCRDADISTVSESIGTKAQKVSKDDISIIAVKMICQKK